MAEQQLLSSKINQGVKAAIAQAIERHRRLGESIAIWHNGKVVILSAEEITHIQTEQQFDQTNKIG